MSSFNHQNQWHRLQSIDQSKIEWKKQIFFVSNVVVVIANKSVYVLTKKINESEMKWKKTKQIEIEQKRRWIGLKSRSTFVYCCCYQQYLCVSVCVAWCHKWNELKSKYFNRILAHAHWTVVAVRCSLCHIWPHNELGWCFHRIHCVLSATNVRRRDGSSFDLIAPHKTVKRFVYGSTNGQLIRNIFVANNNSRSTQSVSVFVLIQWTIHSRIRFSYTRSLHLFYHFIFRFPFFYPIMWLCVSCRLAGWLYWWHSALMFYQ